VLVGVGSVGVSFNNFSSVIRLLAVFQRGKPAGQFLQLASLFVRQLPQL